MPNSYDALLLVSFGGPEGRADVLPFLENVLRGKNVPRARMLEAVRWIRPACPARGLSLVDFANSGFATIRLIKLVKPAAATGSCRW